MIMLGLIPARRGSKGISGKNIRPLGDFPLVEYTLRAATAAKRLDVVAVTTNDPKVAQIASQFKVRVIDRPESMARDESPMIDAVAHALEILAGQGCRPDAVTLLQPTSPFRTAEHIDQAVLQFCESGADSLLSVNAVSEHPCECVRREDGRLNRAVDPPSPGSGRQAFPEYWYVNGAIYITRTSMLLDKREFWDAKSEIFIMPSLNSLDIDGPSDWILAQALLKTHFDSIGLVR